MKINLNEQAVNLEGKEIEGASGNIGKNIASYLAFAVRDAKNTSPIKIMDWAFSFYKGDAVEMDETDKDILIALIETSQDLSISLRSQAMKTIKKQFETQKAK